MYLHAHKPGDVSSVVLAVVGNKADRNEERQISEEEGRQAAQTLGVHLFFETSAKSGMNVNELFEAVAREATKKIPKQVEEPKVEIAPNAAESKQDPCGGSCGGTAPQKGQAI